MQTVIPHEDFDPRLRSNGDEALLVKFEIRAKLHQGMTEKEGRPIYKDVEYVSIRAPGSPDEVCRPATQRDINRFPKHYAAFKNRVEGDDSAEGTLLSEWPAITRSQVEELAFLGIKTVENLAGVTDANAQGIMGINALKQKAKDWLAAANQGVTAAELKKELEKRDELIAMLQAELKASKKPRKKKVSAKKAEPDTQEAEQEE